MVRGCGTVSEQVQELLTKYRSAKGEVLRDLIISSVTRRSFSIYMKIIHFFPIPRMGETFREPETVLVHASPRAEGKV